MINYCLAHDTEWTSRRSAVEDRIQNCTTVLIVSIVTYWPLLLFNYVTEILQKWKMSTHIYQLISPSKQWYFTGAFFTPNWQQWRNKHKTNINNKKICTQRVQTPPRSLHCWRCCSGKDAGPRCHQDPWCCMLRYAPKLHDSSAAHYCGAEACTCRRRQAWEHTGPSRLPRLPALNPLFHNGDRTSNSTFSTQCTLQIAMNEWKWSGINI